MKTRSPLIAPVQWLRRTCAALLVLCVLVLQAQAPASAAVDAAETATWLVMKTAVDADTAPSAVKTALQAPGQLDAHDPPCWGEVIDHAPAWCTPVWLNEAPAQAHCPPLRPPLLANIERPPRA